MVWWCVCNLLLKVCSCYSVVFSILGRVNIVRVVVIMMMRMSLISVKLCVECGMGLVDVGDCEGGCFGWGVEIVEYIG